MFQTVIGHLYAGARAYPYVLTQRCNDISFSQVAIFPPRFLYIPPLFWFPHLLIRYFYFSVMEEQIRGKYNISQVKKYCIPRKYICVEYFQDLENLRVKYHGLMGRVKMK